MSIPGENDLILKKEKHERELQYASISIIKSSKNDIIHDL